MSSKIIETFKTKDNFGKLYTITCYQTIVSANNLNGSFRELDGSKWFKCEFGDVDRINDHTFKILQLDTITKKIIS